MSNHDRAETKNPAGKSSIEWSRRSFLRYVGIAAAAGAVPEALGGCSAPSAEGGVGATTESLGVGATGESTATSFVIARASDGLDMQMDLMNLQVTAGRLVQTSASLPSYIILRTHPQHTSEVNGEVINQGTVNIMGENVQDAVAFSSGPSRLVFALPAGFGGVTFKLDTILGLLSNCTINVAANALSDGAVAGFGGMYTYGAPAGAASLGAPDPTVTAIELPYRLLLSPNEQSRIVHSNPPVNPASSGRVEIFNSRLAVAGANGPDERTQTNRTVRALYTRDAVVGNPSNPFGASGSDTLPFFIRQDIVAQSGTFQEYPSLGNWTPPKSIPVDSFVLTPYGGTLQANANWDGWPGASTGLVTWKHRASNGRDAFVQATLIGYVLPFGLRAIAVMTVKRELNAYFYGAAALYQTWQIHLVDTVKDFSAIPGLPIVGHRAMPFQRVIAQQTVFDIDVPSVTAPVSGQTAQVAAVDIAATLNGVPVTVPMTALDRRGRVVTFNAPLYWICDNATSLSTGVTKYNGMSTPALPPGPAPATTPTTMSTIALNRQRVGLAPATKDHTTVEVDWMTFTVANPGASTTFYPVVKTMSALPEVARNLSNNNAAVLMNYDPSYAPTITSAAAAAATSLAGETTVGTVVSPSATQVLVSFASQVPMQFTSSKTTGGLAAPSAAFQAIGVTSGLASAAGDVSGGTTNWGTLLNGAALFGVIELSDLAGVATKLAAMKPPAFVSEAYTAAERYAAELELLAKPLVAGALPNSAGVLVQLSTALGANSPVAQYLGTLQTAYADISGLLANPTTITAASLSPGGITADVASLATLAEAGGTLDTALAAVGYPNSGLARAARNQLSKVSNVLTAGASAIVSALNAIQQGIDVVRDQKAKIEWISPIPNGGLPSSGVFENLITLGSSQGNGASPSTFALSVEVNGKATDASQALTMFCSLDNFTLNFPPGGDALTLHFDRIFVSEQPGQKLEVDVNFQGLSFGGALTFVHVISSLIPLDGFSDPPHVDVTDSGIDAGFTTGLPNIAAGVLSFENMKLSADLNIPFVSLPSLPGSSPITFSFSFCDSDHPFLVSVAFLGGGGYFNLVVAAGGSGLAIQSLEASISVCAQVSINIVVASGSLSARAGLTIGYDATPGGAGVSITAFVDLRGAVDVLGLISLSVEAYLGLTYDTGTNTLWGECKLIVDIDICFVSKSVSLDFRQSFWGGAPPAATGQRTLESASSTPPMLSPRFADLYTDPNPTTGAQPLQTRWTNYCESFA